MTSATDAMVERARSMRILDVAQRMGAELKRSGSEWVGHCPIGCTKHGDGFAVHPRKGVFLCRPSGAKGDAIALVEHLRGLDFKGAVAFLNEEDWPEPPKRERKIDDDEKRYREKEIATARTIWDRGQPIDGTPAQAYLEARGIAL